MQAYRSQAVHGTEHGTVQDATNPTMDTAASTETVACDGTGRHRTALNDALERGNGGASASDAWQRRGVTWRNDFALRLERRLRCETGSATVTFTATADCVQRELYDRERSRLGDDEPIDGHGELTDAKPFECDGMGNMTALNDWLDSNGGRRPLTTAAWVTWTTLP